MLDGFLDELFKGGEFYGLSDAVGDGEFGECAFIVEEDFVFFDFDGIAVDVSEFIEFDFGKGFAFEFFERLEDFAFFIFRKSPANGGAVREVENVAFDAFVFFDLDVDDIAEKLGCPEPLQVLEEAGDVVG